MVADVCVCVRVRVQVREAFVQMDFMRVVGAGWVARLSGRLSFYCASKGALSSSSSSSFGGLRSNKGINGNDAIII